MKSYKKYEVVMVIKPSKTRRKNIMWSTYEGLAAIQELPDVDGYCVVYSPSKREEGKNPIDKVPVVQLRRLSDNARHLLLQNVRSGWVSLPEDERAEVLRKAESIALLGSNKLDSLTMAILVYLYDMEKIDESCKQGRRKV